MPFQLAHNTSLPLNCSINQTHPTAIFSKLQTCFLTNTFHWLYSLPNTFQLFLMLTPLFYHQLSFNTHSFWLLLLPKTGGHFSHTDFHVHTLQRLLLKYLAKRVYTSLQIFTLTPPCGHFFLQPQCSPFPFWDLLQCPLCYFLHMLAIMHTLHISPSTLCTIVSLHHFTFTTHYVPYICNLWQIVIWF